MNDIKDICTFVVFEINDYEAELKLVTHDKDKAINLLQTFDYGYVQLWCNEEFIKYYELDDNRNISINNASLFLC